MKCFFVFLGLSVFGGFNQVRAHSSLELSSVILTDTIVFDLSQSVLTINNGISYIDFPVILQSTDPTINAVDYWFQFDLNKLTYVSTVSVIPGFDVFSNFNENNQYLSNSSSTASITTYLPVEVSIMKLKFSLNDPCTSVLPTDFFSPTTLINGIVSSSLFIGLGPEPEIQLTTPDPICANTLISFSYDTQINGLAVNSYDWNFDNGLTGTGQTTNTSYSEEGIYTITLNATTADDCVHVYNKDVTVLPSPVADFTSSYDSDLNLVSFTNLSTISSGSNTIYAWEFGDDNTSAEFEPTHTYPSDGFYTATLTVTSDLGCSSSISNLVDASIGIQERSTVESSMYLYPNPSINEITVLANEAMRFFIVDAIGRRVTNETLLSPYQRSLIPLDFLTEGVYMAVGYNENTRIQNRLVIQR